MIFIKRIQNSIISNEKLDHSIYYYACLSHLKVECVISDSVISDDFYIIFHSIYIVLFSLDFSKLVVSSCCFFVIICEIY